MPSVTIYSTPTCHFCHLAKDFFKENNIAYTEHDVAADLDQRKIMMDKTGQLGVPVITVTPEGASEEVIIGFDEERLRTLLIA